MTQTTGAGAPDNAGPALVALFNSFQEEGKRVSKFETRGVGKRRVFEALEARFYAGGRPHRGGPSWRPWAG